MIISALKKLLLVFCLALAPFGSGWSHLNLILSFNSGNKPTAFIIYMLMVFCLVKNIFSVESALF